MEGCAMREPLVPGGVAAVVESVHAGGAACGALAICSGDAACGAPVGGGAICGPRAACDPVAGDAATCDTATCETVACGAAATRSAEAARGADAQADPASPPRRRIDPRVSLAVLLLLNATAFAPKLVGVQVLMVALLAGACVWCGRAGAAVRWCVAYAAIMAVAGLLMLTPQTVSASFATMAVLVRCVFCIGMFASNMVATTRVGEMACALQWLHVPKHGVIAICVALRFFPTLSQEFASVRDALRVRGMPLTAASVVRHPVRTLERVLVPVMSRLAIVADELSNAAMARGMDSACRRTSYYRLRMNAMDWFLLAAFAALAAYLLYSGTVVA